jgi:hypothetical protein
MKDKLVGLLFLALGVLFLLMAVLVNSRAASPILGTFVGDPSPSADGTYQSFTAAMGQQAAAMDTYVEFKNGPDGWGESANYGAHVISDFNGRNGTSMVPVVGLPMATDKSTATSDFQTIASGGADRALTSVFDAYKAAGFKSMVLRPGWEMNGDWYPWSVTSDNAAAFTAAFQRIAEVAHAYNGMTVSVDWNPGYVHGSTPYMSYFPGAQYVDSIGIDTYGAGSGVSSNAPLDDTTDPNTYTLKDAIALAKSTGKPLALPETGAAAGDTTFPQLLAQVISESGVPVSFVNIWDDTNGGVSNLQWSFDPASNQAWRAAFATISGNPGAGVFAAPASGIFPAVGSVSATPEQRTATANAFNQAQATIAANNPSGGLPTNNWTPPAAAAAQPAKASSCPANPSGGTLAFHDVKGALVDPSGNPFLARGVNLSDASLGDAKTILTTYTGINLVRVLAHKFQPASTYSGFVQTMAAHHTVVVLINDEPAPASKDAAKRVQQDVAWYATLAKAFAGNPYVWFGTDTNAPGTPDAVGRWQQAEYQAIRGAGNNSPILLQAIPDRVASYYAPMTNVVWDVSFFVSDPPAQNPPVDQSTVLAGVVTAAQTVPSADGVAPVIVGAFGPVGTSMSGAEAVINSKVVGGAAWAWNGTTPLVSGGAVTDPWGTSVELWINTDVVALTDCQANEAGAAALSSLTVQVNQAAASQPASQPGAMPESDDPAPTPDPTPSAAAVAAAPDIAVATQAAHDAVAARKASPRRH